MWSISNMCVLSVQYIEPKSSRPDKPMYWQGFFYRGILLNQGRGEIHIRCSGIKDYIKARGYNEASKVHSDEEGLPSELGRGKGRREGILHHRCQDFWVLFPSLLVVEVKKKGRESRDRGEYEEVFNM